MSKLEDQYREETYYQKMERLKANTLEAHKSAAEQDTMHK